jgi:CRISPR-associated protein Cmr2
MTDPDFNSSLYWRRKLDAYLHDPLSKPTDVKTHVQAAEALSAADMIQPDERYEKQADFQAAAADRLAFPKSAHLKAPFDGKDFPFHHPLSPECTYRADGTITPGKIDEISQQTRTILNHPDPRLDYLVRWRFQRLWSQWSEPSTAFFPADTRIPDHSLWHHLSITSAFQGCFDRDPDRRVSLLLFSIGPVQPLIEAARRIGDLWSGSYLLSYLVADLLAEISREFGPDHVLFPSVWAQPLVDLQLSEEWQNATLVQAEVAGRMIPTLWEQLWDHPHGEARRSLYTTSSLPNRFLALLPRSDAAATARRLTQRLQERLQAIGQSVLDTLDRHQAEVEELASFRRDRFLPQLEQTLEVHWHTLDLPQSIEESRSLAEKFLPGQHSGEPHPSLQNFLQLLHAWEQVPPEHRTHYGFQTSATAWPLFFSLVSWALDGVKNTRAFPAWSASGSSWKYGAEQAKDDLTGKEEVVLSVANDPEGAQRLGTLLGLSGAAFRANEKLGALNLLKRLWHRTWLVPEHGFDLADFQMPDTHKLAAGEYQSEEEVEPLSETKGGYLAAICIDGDEMGKWVSGQKTPRLAEVLAKDSREYFDDHAKEYLHAHRPLNPSFHLQFSEALGNFANFACRSIVEFHDGRLIYAGGDDVLALVPATKALDCAFALRRAFRGDLDPDEECDAAVFDTYQRQRGFLRLRKPDGFDPRRDYGRQPYEYDVLVPGPSAEVSAGIAIGHAKSPLQDLVREARAAEKRAKDPDQGGRASLALTVLKRSGEILQWGCKWEVRSNEEAPAEVHPGFALLRSIVRRLTEKSLESRFPQKMLALIEPYQGIGGHEDDPHFSAQRQEILAADFDHLLRRSESQAVDAAEQRQWSDWLQDYLRSETDTTKALTNLAGLLRTAGWIARQSA